jgi:NADH-quinone oxidoreductase subunit E
MTNPAHIVETALLLLAAYLLGCILGYAARRILHAGRGTREVTLQPAAAATAPTSVEPRRLRSPAARLAASVEDLPQPAPLVVAPSAAKQRAKAGTSDPKPATLSAPREGGADNLTQIRGIGLKIQASLHALGIFHLDQIAGWNRANVDWVDAQLAFKGRIRRERWVEQALELTKVRASA